MKLLAMLALLFNISCSLHNQRGPASDSLLSPGTVDIGQSRVLPFPQDDDEKFHFYLELKNDQKLFVDINRSDVVVKDGARPVVVDFKRIAQGHYELILDEKVKAVKHLKFVVQEKNLTPKLISFPKPDKKKSSIAVMERTGQQVKMRLNLKDGKNQAIEVQDSPEIILEGDGAVSDLKMIEKGVWEFNLDLPEENHIFYLSVRVNSAYLDRLLRYQHIEK